MTDKTAGLAAGAKAFRDRHPSRAPQKRQPEDQQKPGDVDKADTDALMKTGHDEYRARHPHPSGDAA
jgi:hypothetical protein